MDILLISDQPLAVLALQGLLANDHPGACVVEARRLSDAVEQLAAGQAFHLAVLDLDMPGVGSIGTTALLRELWPQLPLVLLASNECDSTIVRAVELGVIGYVLKSTETETLRTAFRQMLAGNVYTPDFRLAA